MQFRTMREFLVLSETLNFLSASDQLYISQASLSKHIKELETELGAPLFNRSTRRVALTELGMRIVPYARKMVELEDALFDEAKAYRKRMNNRLTIGCVHRMNAVDLSLMTLSFQKSHPEIQIVIITDDSEELQKMLNDGLCDFVIVRENPNIAPDTWDRLCLCKDMLCAFMLKDNPLATEGAVSLASLKDESFMMGANDSLSYNLGQKACYNAGFQPHIIYRGGRPQTFNYVLHGLGVALMFGDPMGVSENEDKIVKCLLEPAVYANVNLVFKNDALSDSGKVFHDFIAQYKF